MSLDTGCPSGHRMSQNATSLIRRLRNMDDAILAALARNTAHLVVVTDAQGAVVWVNAAFEQTTG